jgi:hypothetical protein
MHIGVRSRVNSYPLEPVLVLDYAYIAHPRLADWGVSSLALLYYVPGAGCSFTSEVMAQLKPGLLAVTGRRLNAAGQALAGPLLP